MTPQRPLAANSPPAEQIYVIYNPSAGRGRALARLQEQLAHLKTEVILKPTEQPAHAELLAYEAAGAGCAIIGAAGGDGTVHEVANGILRSDKPDCALAVLPVGSANDYAFSLGLTENWWCDESRAAVYRQVDVGLIETNTGTKRYFVNGAGIGLNGAVTLESRSIRGLQGVCLYSLAMLRALWRRYRYPALVTEMDGVQRERTPTLGFSVAIGQREGNFLLAPDARVDDGWFDYLHAGPIKWWEVLRYLPGMIRGRLPDNHPALWRGRCRHVRLQAEEDLIIHLDGEMFAVPGEGVRDVSITMLPGRLRIFGRFAEQYPPKYSEGMLPNS
jgi:diacylglycerol kinase (ATP)